MMHKLHRVPTMSRHDRFSFALMLCDPVGGGMGTDYTDRVDCPGCLELLANACCDNPNRVYSGGDRPWEGD